MMEQLENEEENGETKSGNKKDKSPKAKKLEEVDEVIQQESKDKKKIDFENTDTEVALDQVGSNLARHAFEKNMKKGSKTKQKMQSILEV